MARMHTKKHGRSKSRKPILAPGTKTTELTNEQIVQLILDYSKQAMSPEKIGEKLKKEHGVPYIKHAMGKRLNQILKEHGAASEIPADLLNLMKKAVNLHSHMEKNAHDTANNTRLHRIESKIWRLTKYYIAKKQLASGWRYDPARAALIIKGK